MKQIATLLRIPRAHHAYIARFGTYDFISRCETIVKNNDKERQKEIDREEREKKRQKTFE